MSPLLVISVNVLMFVFQLKQFWTNGFGLTFKSIGLI